MKNQIISIITLLFLVSTISAFGISSPYWEDHPLILEKGETTTVNLNLQNMAGDEDITIKAEIKQGSEIISLKQDTFVIKARTSDTNIPIEINIPKDIQKDNTTIEIEFKKIEGDSKGIVIGTGMSISFNVIANENSKQKNYPLIILLIGAMIAIVLYALLRKK
jgi:hypothetical protein